MSENSPQEPDLSQELRQEIDEAMAPAESEAL